MAKASVIKVTHGNDADERLDDYQKMFSAGVAMIGEGLRHQSDPR